MSKRPRVDHPFSIIPLDLITDPGVTDVGVRVYGVLSEAAGSDGTSRPSHETIGKRIGKTRRTVQRGIEALAARGWLTIVERYGDDGRQTSNEYTIYRDGRAPRRGFE